MKKIIAALLSCLLLFPGALAEYWTNDYRSASVCTENLPGCQVLQTIMMGSFSQFDPNDNLTVLVYSTALTRLTAITPEEIEHFLAHFDTTEEQLLDCYYLALGHCLWADIVATPIVDDPQAQYARQVLLLFLSPDHWEDTLAQRAAIRAAITDETIALIAEKTATSPAFINHLLYDG